MLPGHPRAAQGKEFTLALTRRLRHCLKFVEAVTGSLQLLLLASKAPFPLFDRGWGRGRHPIKSILIRSIASPRGSRLSLGGWWLGAAANRLDLFGRESTVQQVHNVRLAFSRALTSMTRGDVLRDQPRWHENSLQLTYFR
jgi:hypothetical protein